jgi:FkbM family methyltransferase
MGFAKLIKKSDFLYETYLSFRVLLQHKKLRPTKVRISGTEHSIYVKPNERRAKALLLTGANGQQWIKHFWAKANQLISPSLILDCGINYGEILYYPVYCPDSVVVGFEADPTLIDILERSKSEHPSKSQITIFNSLISDSQEDDASFYIKKSWSGGSSAIFDESLKKDGILEVKVSKNSIDNLLKPINYSTDSLLFKIDVEGYEPFVLAGMKDTLTKFKTVLGCIEYTPQFLDKLNLAPQDFIDSLHSNFKIFVWNSNSNLSQVTTRNPEEFNTIVKNSFTKWDLILTNNISLLPELGYKIS